LATISTNLNGKPGTNSQIKRIGFHSSARNIWNLFDQLLVIEQKAEDEGTHPDLVNYYLTGKIKRKVLSKFLCTFKVFGIRSTLIHSTEEPEKAISIKASALKLPNCALA
jgi:hypothetical protein